MSDVNPPSPPSPQSPSAPSTSASARKKEEKARKKDQRSWENVMKSMGDIPDAEKLAILKDKYTELYNELRCMGATYHQLEKKVITIKKERDHTQCELNKNILAKAKLESLCRELQKQNKAIKDENITRVKEEEEKRREVATNFTERLNSLSSMMDENKDKSVRLREENMNMTLKLTELYNKFQERENHLADVNLQLETQKELFESKIKKMELEFKADRKAWEEEGKNLLTNLLKSNETNRLLEENIKSMQANLDVYKNQYSDFEQTMSRSNEVFKTFHGEINKLQKSNTTLEKERCEYISKWQSCHTLVVEISERNQQLSKKLEMSEKKVGTLEKLCRQLQVERSVLHKQLQDKIELATVAQHLEDKLKASVVDTALLTTQQLEEKLQSSSIDFAKLTNSHSLNEGTVKAKPKKSCNGDLKTTNNLGSDDEDYDDYDSDDDDEIPSLLRTPEAASSEHMMQLHFLQPDLVGDPGASSRPPMDYSGLELQTGSSVPQLQAEYKICDTASDDSSNLDGTLIELQGPTTSSEIFIKETRSAPVTEQDHFDIQGDAGSSDQAHTDVSVESLPLYKPVATTDVSKDMGLSSRVKQSFARTDITDPSQDPAPVEDPQWSADATDSSATIDLKESEGKTEIKE